MPQMRTRRCSARRPRPSRARVNDDGTRPPDPYLGLGIRGGSLDRIGGNSTTGTIALRPRSVLRTFLPDLLHLLERLAEIRQPFLLPLRDQSDAPGERVAARTRDPGIDQRVQNLSLGHPEPRHRGDREGSEQLALIRTPCTPADLAAEAPFGLVRDPHPLRPGVLSEPGDPRFGGRGTRLRAGIVGELGLGHRTDDEDLVAVERHVDRPDEPLRGEPPGEPSFEVLVEVALFSHVVRLHHYINTSTA